MPSPSSSTIAALRSVAGLLQAGRHAEARARLGALLERAPATADAHRLLALSFFQSGEHAQALHALSAWLALQPANSEALVLRGRVLAASGRLGEAEQAWRRALELAPDDVAAAALLARLLLGSGRAQAARPLLAPFFAARRDKPEILMLLAHALMELGELEQAEAVLTRWQELEPRNPEVRLRLATVLLNAGRPAEAAVAARAGIAAGGRGPDASYLLARALMGESRFAEAETELRAVVRAQPANADAQANLSELVWMRTGDPGQACAELDHALRLKPDLHALRVDKARLLASAGRATDAYATIEAGLRLAPDAPQLLRSASTIALEFDGERAFACAERLVAVQPQEHEALVALGNAALATGRARQALELSARLHRQQPLDGRALALRADALRMLGDERYRELLDYRNFVRAAYIDAPEGWPDRASYVAELYRDLMQLHTLHAHPVRNSLRGGSQVRLDPPTSSHASIRAFPQAIGGAIRRQMAGIGHGSDPMRSRNTGRYRLSGMWSVRLRPHGFHVNHYHQDGWISSACYLHLPAVMDEHPGEGWLKFGEPGFPTRPALPPEYFIRPEPGLLALFPSYMWHGTVPFSGAPDDTRVTIAFDVVPD